MLKFLDPPPTVSIGHWGFVSIARLHWQWLCLLLGVLPMQSRISRYKQDRLIPDTSYQSWTLPGSWHMLSLLHAGLLACLVEETWALPEFLELLVACEQRRSYILPCTWAAKLESFLLARHGRTSLLEMAKIQGAEQFMCLARRLGGHPGLH